MHALEIHYVTLDDSGRGEIRVLKPGTWKPILTMPGVRPGPAGLDPAEEKVRAALPDAESYNWDSPWTYEPTRREVINIKRLWRREEPQAVETGAHFGPADLTGTGLSWNPTSVEYHGPGRVSVAGEDRFALAGDWPAARPEDCTDESRRGTWYANGLILICPGCGLDCT